jgi:tetratricopeptide (TPR) repeat protein
MTYVGRLWRSDEQTRFAACAALWLGLTAGCLHLTGCAQPTSSHAAESATTTARESDLEQRLRDLQQAEALYLSGRFKEAQAAFERLARSYPNNPEVWFRLGNTLMKQGLYDEAAGALQTSIGLDPGNGRAALNLALARLAQAQSAVDLARGHFPADSPERKEVEGIDRRLRSILSDPSGGNPAR